MTNLFETGFFISSTILTSTHPLYHFEQPYRSLIRFQPSMKPCIVNLIKSTKMKTSLRTRFCSLFIVFSTIALAAKADGGIVRPAQFNLNAFVKASVNFMSGKSSKADVLLEKLKSKSSDRICVCEIMELQNNNAEFTDVAVFAEKINTGDMGKGYKTAEREIAKEKKQMKAMFFDEVKVNTKIAVATDCLSLYMKLRQNTNGLKMYDILDADARSAVK